MVKEPEVMKGMIINFFSRMFIDDDLSVENRIPGMRFPKVDKEQWDQINAPFNNDEIKKDVFEMNPNKAQVLMGIMQASIRRRGSMLESQLLIIPWSFLDQGI